MLKMLGLVWELSLSWKFSGFGFFVNGFYVAFFGEKSLVRDLFIFVRNVVLVIIYVYGGVVGGVG